MADRRGAIVTGGSSGIGLVARTARKLEKAADEVRSSRTNPESIVSAHPADLCDLDAIAGTIKAIPPERVAQAILTGVDRGKYYIIPGFESRFYFRLKGLLPEVFFRIVDRDVREVRSGR